MHKFEKINTLSVNLYELHFYLEDHKLKHKLIPIEISKIKTEKEVVDSLIYTNHYALNKKLNVFFGKEDNKSTCRQCLDSYTSENMIIKHK